jgi:thiol-disulfide isomerase/thioredoxin
LENALWNPHQAPKIEGIEAWINSPPLQWDDLKGKVVLVYFWTYSCINCVRTLPYLKYWYQKYHDKGLVIIGMHTPEFDFEKNLANVEEAVKHHVIAYPVALDNQFKMWNNFSNHYWPAQYLINQQGQVVYEHFGEGNDDVIENNIRFLLNMGLRSKQPELPVPHQSYFITPETYLGYGRADEQASPTLIHDQTALYHAPPELLANAWALDGRWNVSDTKITSEQADASLRINFQARNVYIVMGTRSARPIRVKVLLNGQPLVSNQGTDVSQGSVWVDKDSIYEVIKLPKSEHGILQICPNEPGLEVYTFTFGD